MTTKRSPKKTRGPMSPERLRARDLERQEHLVRSYVNDARMKLESYCEQLIVKTVNDTLKKGFTASKITPALYDSLREAGVEAAKAAIAQSKAPRRGVLRTAASFTPFCIMSRSDYTPFSVYGTSHVFDADTRVIAYEQGVVSGWRTGDLLVAMRGAAMSVFKVDSLADPYAHLLLTNVNERDCT